MIRLLLILGLLIVLALPLPTSGQMPVPYLRQIVPGERIGEFRVGSTTFSNIVRNELWKYGPWTIYGRHRFGGITVCTLESGKGFCLANYTLYGNEIDFDSRTLLNISTDDTRYTTAEGLRASSPVWKFFSQYGTPTRVILIFGLAVIDWDEFGISIVAARIDYTFGIVALVITVYPPRKE